jgi:hypothetical protein
VIILDEIFKIFARRKLNSELSARQTKQKTK